MAMKTKKELKDEYLRIKPRYGVFQIRNVQNNAVFIDSSVNLDKIWNRHKLELEFGNHRCTALLEAWKELGEQAFVFEVVSEIKQDDESGIDYAAEAKSLCAMFIEEAKERGMMVYNK